VNRRLDCEPSIVRDYASPLALRSSRLYTFDLSTPAKLALEDGTVFAGTSIGADGEVDGEVCFNTSMTGYQEILTDPSYRGQIVTMTYPQIGNYGVNAEDVESWRPQLAGFVVREHSRTQSNFRSEQCLTMCFFIPQQIAAETISRKTY
jgi:carbamoyl-phosphate synthase small subunit